MSSCVDEQVIEQYSSVLPTQRFPGYIQDTIRTASVNIVILHMPYREDLTAKRDGQHARGLS